MKNKAGFDLLLRFSIVPIIILHLLLFWAIHLQVEDPQLNAVNRQVIINRKYKVFVPHLSSIPPEKFSKTMGVESEASMAVNGRWFNRESALKMAIKGFDVVASPWGYDWRIPDRQFAGYYVDWITIKMTPEWMLKDGDRVCNLPRPEYWGAYAAFVQAVIDRYGPEYIEIWNEPDAAASQHPTLYGCIGDGKLYGEFVSFIHKRVSGAQIIAGAVSSPYSPFVSDMFSTLGDNYDGFSFHCYQHFYDDHLYGDIRDLYRYATTLTDKPVYVSETAVMYKRGTEAEYEKAQLEHYRRLMEIPTVKFWYTVGFNGWPVEMNTDLVRRDPVTRVISPRPVWLEYSGYMR